MRTSLFLLVVLLNLASGIDVIIESLRQLIDKNTDPCDNFYRHTCPLGSPEMLWYKLLDIKPAEKGVWDNLQITKGNSNFSELPEQLSKLYLNMCENGLSTGVFFDRVKDVFQPKEVDECDDAYCLSHLQYDPDCNRVSKFIKSIFADQLNGTALVLYDKFVSSIDLDIYAISSISQHLDLKLEDGIEETNDILNGLKTLAADMILETPWAINNNATDVVLAALEATVLKKDYAKILKDTMDRTFEHELKYRKCKKDYNHDKNANLLCFLFVARHADIKLNSPFFENILNAGNTFPNLNFGMPFYMIAKNAEVRAAKLGMLGWTVGHELSHTLIQSRNDFVLPYFSENAIQCIQNQFNSTCNEFKEISCTTDDVQIDDNGADMLGFQLAYKLFKNEYGDRTFETYEPLNVTYQQLFFYSSVVFHCEGVQSESFINDEGILDDHATRNVRINVLVNHPAFQEAFECPDDSRMMKSATEQCIIYGQGAPENKRKRH